MVFFGGYFSGHFEWYLILASLTVKNSVKAFRVSYTDGLIYHKQIEIKEGSLVFIALFSLKKPKQRALFNKATKTNRNNIETYMSLLNTCKQYFWKSLCPI